MSTVALKNKSESAVKKAKEAAKKSVKKVQDNPITAIKIVGVGLAFYLGYKLFKGVSNATSNILNPDVPNNSIDIVFDDNDITTNTITPFQANQYALQLIDAINHTTWFGTSATDEDTIEAIFDKINSDDFKLIYNAFGKRPYDEFEGRVIGDGIVGALTNTFFGEEKDLVYILKVELSSLWDKTIYNKVKSIVTSAGFAF